MAKFLIKYLITQYKKEIYEKCMRCDKKESQNNNSFEFVDKMFENKPKNDHLMQWYENDL